MHQLPVAVSRRFVPGLLGLILVGGLLLTASSVLASSDLSLPGKKFPEVEAVEETEGPSSRSARPAGEKREVHGVLQEADSATEEDRSVAEQILEPILFTFLFFILFGVAASLPLALGAVTTVIDSGWLRMGLSVLGWICALGGGLVVGLFGSLIAAQVFGYGISAQYLITSTLGGAMLFMGGYYAGRVWVRRRFDSMPEEQFRTWEQTLEGGALVGFGYGSVASLLRSAVAVKGGGSGFGGFGGGSFGGGGASGSWGAASGTAGGASSVSAGATAAVGGTSGATAASSGVAPGVAGAGATAASASAGATGDGLLVRVKRWLRHVQWYHLVAFGFIGLVFLSLGRLAAHVLPIEWILGLGLFFGGYWLWQRRESAEASVRSGASLFRGGEASGSWS